MSEDIEPVCCAASRGQSSRGQQLRPQSPATFRGRPSRGMIPIPGGEFIMGTDDSVGYPADGEGPARRVEVHPFFMDVCAVTNAQFRRFVKATGYHTEAERYGWSFVFDGFVLPNVAQRVTHSPVGTPWWRAVEGATWQQPEGPGSNVRARLDHPVVHVSWNDAVAFSEWAGKRLPTEAEWEFSARGGLSQKTYAWGDELTPDGIHRCNIWQGSFPNHNNRADGYTGTCPVRCFLPNGFGLYNMAGNVWEWCSDWFSAAYPKTGVQENPQGPSTGSSKSIRGGSYLCHQIYCNRYRVAARSSNTLDSSTGNLGFRCARDAA